MVLAIDTPEKEEVTRLAAQVGALVDGLKLGVPVFLKNGLGILVQLRREFDGPLVADLKVADIGFRDLDGRGWSGTNKAIVGAAVGAGIDYVICHTIMGSSGIQESVDTAHSMGGRVLTLPYMSHRGAELFFDAEVYPDKVSPRLRALGFGKVADMLLELQSKKIGGGWRLPAPSISDLVLLIGEEVGVDGYIAPANNPQVMQDYRKMTKKTIMAPGVGRQGGSLRDVFTILGPRSAAIAGHSIYADADPVAACRRLLSERDEMESEGRS